MPSQYRVKVTETAEGHLRQVRSDRQTIKRQILRLESEPEKRGQQLTDDLSHLHSVKVGQYRIIYKVVDSISTVFIKAVGVRKEDSRDDIYRLASKLFGK